MSYTIRVGGVTFRHDWSIRPSETATPPGLPVYTRHNDCRLKKSPRRTDHFERKYGGKTGRPAGVRQTGYSPGLANGRDGLRSDAAVWAVPPRGALDSRSGHRPPG